MFRKTVPDDRNGNADTSFAEFHCCSRHGQISTFRTTETGSAREIRRRYANVMEICATGTSDTVKCRESIYNVSKVFLCTGHRSRTDGLTDGLAVLASLQPATPSAAQGRRIDAPDSLLARAVLNC